MKVVHLTTVHPSFDTRIFYKQAKTLVRAGYDVTMIAQHEKDEVVDGVKIIALPKPKNRFIRIFGLNWRALRLALRQRADIYHFHDPELIPVGLLLKPRCEKVIYDVHEDLPRQVMSKYWIHPWLRGGVSKVAELLEASTARILDAIVAATPVIAARFPQKKTVVVQNLPIVSELQAPQETPYKERPFCVAYLGGITAVRGALEMVRALEHLPSGLQVKLVMAGEFSPSRLYEDVRQLPAWERVEFLGWQDRQQLPHLLDKARVGLVVFHPEPNHIEAQPNKLFEYMAAGIPVVASDFPLWRQIVKEAGCGLLVDPLDPGAIARAVAWLLEHPGEAEEMGKRGREQVVAKYNWEREAEKLLELYWKLR